MKYHPPLSPPIKGGGVKVEFHQGGMCESGVLSSKVPSPLAGEG